VRLLGERFATRTTAQWLEVLRGVVPIAPVRSLEDALDVDDLRRREMLAEYEHPSLGLVRAVGLPLRVGRFAPAYRPGPRFGEGQHEVLAEVGYSPDEIDALAASGAFGAPGSVEEAPAAAAG
jgi:formyl-CoA transferase